MKITRTPQVICMLVVGTISLMSCADKEYDLRELADNVYAISRASDGSEQVVIASENGLVVLNSFWSEAPAREFKQHIVSLLGRDDFAYLIDMTDRLDTFGGNAAYADIPIVGQQGFVDEFRGQEDAVAAEVQRLIAMWQEKELIARERLPNHEPGSDEAINELQWINTCKAHAEELESGFSLVLPTEVYQDERTIDLGDITLHLAWFGRAGYDGMTIITIPEAKLAIVPGFILHGQHLAPYPMAEFAVLDVPRWIEVLQELLEGDHPVDYVACGMNLTDVWSRNRALAHLHYIRKLWNDVAHAAAEGKDLSEIYTQLSLDTEYAFVKEMPAYTNNGDQWIRPQHMAHIRLFYLQHKNPATEMVQNLSGDALAAVLDNIRQLADDDGIYIEENGFNSIGYRFLAQGRVDDALAVFKFNVDMFPDSFNVYDSYGEVLAASGDVENAIVNYEKSLALNPDNTNAKEKLTGLRG